MFDLQTSVQLGQLAFYIVSGLYFIITLKGDIRVVNTTIEMLEKRGDSHSAKLNILTEAFTKLAVQDNRLKNIEDDIKDLKHGKGFVTGEYDRHGNLHK